MPEVGERLADKYRLTKLLGEGGMGAVYEAEHEELGKLVAIKFLHPDIAKDESGSARFKREARAAAATGHPSIVDVYDIGTADDGSIFLVMENLRGESMGELLEREGSLEPELAAYILAEVLSALHTAHASGIVHRDIKPDNVFLVRTGKALPGVKLLDFGASQVVDPANPEERLTRTGLLLGTPYYMAPEQAAGEKDLDQRVDVYAVGVMLYESLTGDVPFSADNVLAQIREIREAPLVPPTELDPEISEEIEAVVLTAMARDREVRYHTAIEMLDDLLPFMTEAARTQISMPQELEAPDPSDSKKPTRGRPTAASTGATTDMAWTGKKTSPGAPGAAKSRGPVIGIAIGVALLIAGGVGVFFMNIGDSTLGEVDGAETRGVVDAAVATAATVEDASAENTDESAANEGDAAVAESDGQAPMTPDVTITLNGVPEGATVSLDGEEIDGPELRMPRSDQEREVVVRATDGREWRHGVIFTEDGSVDVELAPQRRVRIKRGFSKRVGGAGAPTKQPASEGSSQPAVSEPATPPTKRSSGDGESPQLQENFRL